MFEQLLFGLPFVSDDWTPGIIHDDPKKKSLAYSCFCDPHNIGFQQARIVVLQNILTHPQLRGRFHFLDSNGKIRWKPGPCLAYLQACEQVEMMLFAASHTSVGAPARGTEFASHLLANLAGGHIRNVFVLLQLLILMGTYNKTSHITGGASRIARVPHPETGWLWMLYISHVRPVVIEWQRAFGTLAAASRAATHLFFGLHRPVTSTDLSRALSHHTQRFLGVRINIRLWRHITTFFLNHHCPDAVEWPRVDEDILQNPAKAHLAMQPSLGWHQILGFRSRSQNKTFQIREHAIQPLPISPQFPASALHSLVAKVHLLFMSELRPALKAAHRRDLAAINQVFNRDPANFSLILSPLTPSHRPFRSHLADLKLFLRNDHAVFKDFQQAHAVELLSDSSSSLLIISPTGLRFHVTLLPLPLLTERLARFRENPACLFELGHV
ncbi:hypothetical protein BDN71DRAFT_1514769 [Pleurotus eryngii]|uniref:Uncharacterized protein n=1 Tax=Pleurotus eryngii TaxID=5323 RepID=A0A9P5ZE93_PLEER|nr:hypothetical protein BDN71DRAFT_1514769 [Pleurotus eryngii]